MRTLSARRQDCRCIEPRRGDTDQRTHDRCDRQTDDRGQKRQAEMFGQRLDYPLHRFGRQVLIGKRPDAKADTQQRVGQCQRGDSVRGMEATVDPDLPHRRLGSVFTDPRPAKQANENQGRKEAQERGTEDPERPLGDLVSFAGGPADGDGKRDRAKSQKVAEAARAAGQCASDRVHYRLPTLALMRELVVTPICSNQWSIRVRSFSTEACIRNVIS